MDNLSHSVVGLAAGELIHRCLQAEPEQESNRARRRLLLVSCWIASNFPDLDLVLTPLLPAPLGYLLHHRGHTHTLLYAIPQALAVWGLIWLLWPRARRLLRHSPTARVGLALSIAGGFILHMLMDSLNSYGIHPFHPFDSNWYFGDMVFILEPWFWIVFGIPMAMTVKRRWLAAAFAAMLIGLPVYFTLQNYLSWGSMAALGLAAFLLAVIQRHSLISGASGKVPLLAAFLIGIGFTGVQGFASSHARQFIQADAKMKDEAASMLDVSLTPFPGNPLCWTFVSIESIEVEGSYRLRRGLLSLAPSLMPVSACPEKFLERPWLAGSSPRMAVVLEERGSLKTLRALKANNCHFEAWLRFARLPLLRDNTASDLRFSSSPRGNFTTMEMDDFKEKACSSHVPRWNFPRSDLLDAPE